MVRHFQDSQDTLCRQQLHRAFIRRSCLFLHLYNHVDLLRRLHQVQCRHKISLLQFQPACRFNYLQVVQLLQSCKPQVRVEERQLC